jgi:hypothetical protein
MLESRVWDCVFGGWTTPGGVTKRLEVAVEGSIRSRLMERVYNEVMGRTESVVRDPVLRTWGAMHADLYDR